MTLNFKFKVLLLISCFILCFVFDVIEGQVLAAGRMNTHYGSRSDELSVDVGSNAGGGRDLPENKMKTSFQTSLVDLDEDYDFNVPPPSMLEPGGPVHVNFSINLRNIFQVTCSNIFLYTILIWYFCFCLIRFIYQRILIWFSYDNQLKCGSVW